MFTYVYTIYLDTYVHICMYVYIYIILFARQRMLLELLEAIEVEPFEKPVEGEMLIEKDA